MSSISKKNWILFLFSMKINQYLSQITLSSACQYQSRLKITLSHLILHWKLEKSCSILAKLISVLDLNFWVQFRGLEFPSPISRTDVGWGFWSFFLVTGNPMDRNSVCWVLISKLRIIPLWGVEIPLGRVEILVVPEWNCLVRRNLLFWG